MSAPTSSTNNVTVRKLYSTLNSLWNNVKSAFVTKGSAELARSKFHRIRPAFDNVIGEQSIYNGWVLDIESPNPNAPGGYDRLTPQRAKEIVENGEVLLLDVYAYSAAWDPFAIQVLFDIRGQNPLNVRVDFIRSYSGREILQWEHYAIFTPTNAPEYLQMEQLDIVNHTWYETKGAVTRSQVDQMLPTASTATPLMDGTASAGSSTSWAKGDHVHPTDTTREAVANKNDVLDPTSTTDYVTAHGIADFVNSSVATNTANFLGNFKLTDLGLTYPATNVQIASALNSHTWPQGVSVTNNDYVYVEIENPQTTGVDDRVERYKYRGLLSSWGYEYTLNNSSFTAAEIAALDSGISSTKVGNYDSHLADTDIHVTYLEKTTWNGKQNALTTSQQSAINSGINPSKVLSYDEHIYNTSNPHQVTKEQVGLSNVGNFKAVSTVANQGLESSEKTNARTNIGAGTYSLPSGGIPSTDLASSIQTSLGKADSAVQSITFNGVAQTASSGDVDLGYHPTTGGQSAATVQALIQELRQTVGGRIGSVEFTSASNIDNILIAATWYNFIWLPHRQGGTSSDNSSFGTLILTPMTSTPDLFIIEGSGLGGNSPTYRAQRLLRRSEVTSSYDPLGGAPVNGAAVWDAVKNYVLNSSVGAADGVAPLDSSSIVPLANLPRLYNYDTYYLGNTVGNKVWWKLCDYEFSHVTDLWFGGSIDFEIFSTGYEGSIRSPYGRIRLAVSHGGSFSGIPQNIDCRWMYVTQDVSALTLNVVVSPYKVELWGYWPATDYGVFYQVINNHIKGSSTKWRTVFTGTYTQSEYTSYTSGKTVTAVTNLSNTIFGISKYATKIGTMSSHPAIGSPSRPVYVDSNGDIQQCDLAQLKAALASA